MNYLQPRRSTVLVMHPDPIFSAGLVTALRQAATLEVVVHEGDGLGPGESRVDVVITDYDAAMRLVEDPVARESRAVPETARILAVTSNCREADIRRAIQAGVHGYLLIGGPLTELIESVNVVAGGARYLSLSVAQRMADSLTRATLTSREVEVLRLVALGQPNKVIARQLRIELGTVKSHISAIMAKLDASSRTHAARIAASRGLVEDLSTPEGNPGPIRTRTFASVPLHA